MYALIYINTYAVYILYVYYNVCICILYVCEYTEYIKCIISILTLVAQMVQNLPAMWDTWVRSLGWEDPLEEGMATPVAMYSCLEYPMDRGAWQATVHGVHRVRHD